MKSLALLVLLSATVGAVPPGLKGTSGIATGAAGGDLGGTYPNPTVNQAANSFSVQGASFSVGGSTFAINNGMVGIGTTNPKYVLHNASDSYTAGQAIVGGTMTVQGAAFSVGGSTFVVTNGGAQASTMTTSNLQVNSTATFGAAVVYSSSSKLASYTMTSNDNFIFVYSTWNVISTATLPSAAAYGPQRNQTVTVFKADSSTTPVVIIPSGNDTINVNAATVTLCSQGQSQEFVSDGGTGWYLKGKARLCSNVVGAVGDPISASALTTSNTYHALFYLNEPCDTKQIGFNLGTSTNTGDMMTFAIYKVNQAEQVLTLMTSTGPFNTPTVSASNRVVIPTVHLAEGVYTYMVGFNNATDQITRFASGLIGGVLIGNTAANMLPNIPVKIGIATLSTNSSTRSPAIGIGCWGGFQ